MSGPSHLAQILLPKETGDGRPVEQAWFESLLDELIQRFGGATSFPGLGKGLWQSGGEVEQDHVAVIEAMTEELDPAFWKSLRGRLERDLSPDEIVIRVQKIMKL